MVLPSGAELPEEADALLTRWAAARPATAPSSWWPSALHHPAGERNEHKNFNSAQQRRKNYSWTISNNGFPKRNWGSWLRALLKVVFSPLSPDYWSIIRHFHSIDATCSGARLNTKILMRIYIIVFCTFPKMNCWTLSLDFVWFNRRRRNKTTSPDAGPSENESKVFSLLLKHGDSCDGDFHQSAFLDGCDKKRPTS